LAVDQRITEIELVGVFEKGNKKSVTVRFFMRRDDKTWESSEIDDIFEKVIKVLESKCGAEVPR
jgi:phenylalanyl-tRNA synthetase beta subunit